MESKGPDQLVAFATWVDGEPARGGLLGRLRQGLNSVTGPGFAPVLLTAMPDTAGNIGTAERQRLTTLLRGFVDAQPGLTDQVRAASRIP